MQIDTKETYLFLCAKDRELRGMTENAAMECQMIDFVGEQSFNALLQLLLIWKY